MHVVESLNQYPLAFPVERSKVQLQMGSFHFFFFISISDIFNFILALPIVTENSLHFF